MKWRKKFLVSFGSDRLRNKRERAQVRRALQRGLEPHPRYSTGKFWVD